MAQISQTWDLAWRCVLSQMKCVSRQKIQAGFSHCYMCCWVSSPLRGHCSIRKKSPLLNIPRETHFICIPVSVMPGFEYGSSVWCLISAVRYGAQPSTNKFIPAWVASDVLIHHQQPLTTCLHPPARKPICINLIIGNAEAFPILCVSDFCE